MGLNKRRQNQPHGPWLIPSKPRPSTSIRLWLNICGDTQILGSQITFLVALIVNIVLPQRFAFWNANRQTAMAPKKGVCPLLLNDRACPGRGKDCQYSHKASVIRWWKATAGQGRCAYGPDCSYLFTGNCVWFHTAKDRAAVYRLRKLRTAEVSSGLVHLESLTILPVGIGVEGLSIAHVQELASFNKVADGEIVVPGLCSFTVNNAGPCAM